MPKQWVAVVALGLALQGPAALAQSEGWGTGYQMGTSYAGVSGADGTRLTFYCGDAAAARALIRRAFTSAKAGNARPPSDRALPEAAIRRQPAPADASR